jgi:hypothetical protein
MGMWIDKFVNAALRKLWPEDEEGERAVRFHSQNLNERRDGSTGIPHHGRCWLNVGRGRNELEFRFEWALWHPTRLFSIGLESDGETGGFLARWGVIPATFYLGIPLPRTWEAFKRWRYSDRNVFDIYLDMESGSLRWQFGGSTMGWSSKTPKWKDGSFDIPDFVLGKTKYTEGEPEVHKVQIPMPEGAYDAVIEMSTDTWKRPRWFATRIRRCHTKIDIGIPFPGKGENSWDCGEDCSYGVSGPAETIEAAIAMNVESVLRSRRRYGGSVMKVYPPPAIRAIEVAERRKKAAEERSRGGDVAKDDTAEATDFKPRGRA